MRPIIAIRNDIEVARSESGSESLARLADELHRESIPEARAEALFVNGLLHLRTGMTRRARVRVEKPPNALVR